LEIIDRITYNTCNDSIWVRNLKDEWTSAQKAQNNEFIKSELENWDLVN